VPTLPFSHPDSHRRRRNTDLSAFTGSTSGLAPERVAGSPGDHFPQAHRRCGNSTRPRKLRRKLYHNRSVPTRNASSRSARACPTHQWRSSALRNRLKASQAGQPPRHQARHSHVDGRLARGRKHLVVLAQPALLIKPRERCLQDGETASVREERRDMLPNHDEPALASEPTDGRFTHSKLRRTEPR
jgi:hypothetical protein